MLTRRTFLCAAAAFGAKDEKVTIAHGGAIVLEYRYSSQLSKPYVHPLCGPDGIPLSLDRPKDHAYLRGLMVGWSEVNGLDFWSEGDSERCGQIVHKGFERRTTTGISAVNHWVAEGKVLLVERRTLLIPPPSPQGTWLDWTTELDAPGEPVTIAGGHADNGLGIRLSPAMKGGTVLNSNGATAIGQANGDPARWCAYSGAGNTVVFFDHPSNPRSPNPFFVMNKPFGYMSAAPTFRHPLQLEVNQKVRFRWGVLAFAGAPLAQQLHQWFTMWTGK